MIIFGLLTIRNIRKQRRQIQSIHSTSHRQRDRQMIRLMLAQTSVFILLLLPLTIASLINSFVSTTVISQSMQISLIRLTSIVLYFNMINSFYLNTLTSTIYRREGLKILNVLMKRVFNSMFIERYYLQQLEPTKTFTMKTTNYTQFHPT
ncbi:unnamed protein product [Didymodactylos carnosus]|uniref:G-protein coupled receptors family 1 profile domain-containing protein n=2 Tax=Didymodactylos carnosus TaxID=1234261 RepID=A0A8S2DYQ2_9BILA|nr:unnamed protein product [Didymodactylos carnosus]CAF3834013.1 unnamed protein product [Didymodactylos carnosus]